MFAAVDGETSEAAGGERLEALVAYLVAVDEPEHLDVGTRAEEGDEQLVAQAELVVVERDFLESARALVDELGEARVCHLQAPFLLTQQVGQICVDKLNFTF